MSAVESRSPGRNGGDGSSDKPDGLSRSLLADDPVVGELLGDFLAGLPARVAAMTAALEGGELERVRTLAHAAKGATASYGFPGLSLLAARLEEAARQGDLGAARAAAAELETACTVATGAR